MNASATLVGLGRGTFLRASLAILIAVPLFAWWATPTAPSRYYERVLGSNAAILVRAISGRDIMLMRSPDNPGFIGVFEPELAGGKGQSEPVTVVRADRIRVFLPWLIGLVLVWPLDAPKPAGPRRTWPGGRALLDLAWRRATLLLAAAALHFLTQIAAFAVEAIGAYAAGNPSLGLPSWGAWSESTWSTVSWFMLLIGGPFFPVLIVAGLARLLRAESQGA